MRSSKALQTLGALVLVSSAYAADLGVIGPTYSIGEESALEMIMKRLRSMERNGDLKRLQEQAVARSMGSIKNMKPVDGITTVRAKSSRLIDPTVKYENAVTTDDGRIVVPAGASINPLTITQLSKTLVFFDGRDPEQRDAIGRLLAKPGPYKYKPILVAGSWLDLTKAWKTQVFFDQQGTLSRRFGVTAVPATIRQQGNMLLLEELPAKELAKGVK